MIFPSVLLAASAFTLGAFAAPTAVTSGASAAPTRASADVPIIIGYRIVARGQYEEYQAAGGTLTMTSKLYQAGRENGDGVYTFARAGDWVGATDNILCVIMANAEAFNDVPKAWIPKGIPWTDKDVNDAIRALDPTLDPAKTLRLSTITGATQEGALQMAIPPGLLNSAGGSLDISLRCYDGETPPVRLPEVEYQLWNSVRGEPQGRATNPPNPWPTIYRLPPTFDAILNNFGLDDIPEDMRRALSRLNINTDNIVGQIRDFVDTTFTTVSQLSWFFMGQLRETEISCPSSSLSRIAAETPRVILFWALWRLGNGNRHKELRSVPGVELRTRDDNENNCAWVSFIDNLTKAPKAPNSPNTCNYIRDLEFGLALANENSAGTYGEISVELRGPSGSATFAVLNQPSLNTETWKSVDMEQFFNSTKIPINGINEITLFGDGGNDAWKLKDIRLRANCAESGSKTEVHRYKGIQKWYYRKDGGVAGDVEYYNPEAPARFDLAPTDWHMRPVCRHIKELKYKFQLANENWAGTDDELLLKVGGMHETSLGVAPSPGHTREGTIDLKTNYGSETIDLQEIKAVDIRALRFMKAVLGGDGWKIQGITFTARCAGLDKEIELKKYQSINAFHTYLNGFHGIVGLEDWYEVGESP